MNSDRPGAPNRILLIGAFGAVYLFWGTTYLAMRYAVVDLPPFFMAGTRFLLAGGLLYAWLRRRGVSKPGRAHWPAAVIVGGLMLLCANGAVAWAEQFVESGLTALLLASMPLWMILLEWLSGTGRRPSLKVGLSLLVGMVGVAFLAVPTELAGVAAPHLLGSCLILTAALCWATGSILSTRLRLPESPVMGAAMQMLAGGTLLLVLSGAVEDWGTITLGTNAVIAWLYLVAFGSLISFSAYIWLMRVSTPARVATVSYVNPVVAVLLGWLIADETISLRTVVSAALIVTAVAVIIRSKSYAHQKGENA